MKRFKKIAYVAVAVLTGALAACSASSSSHLTGAGTSTTGLPALPATLTASGPTVSVMTIGSINSASVSHPGMQTAAQQAVAFINAHGGLGARHDKINLVFCDNQFNVSQNASCARTAVSDHVIATVGDLDCFAGVNSNAILTEAKIPRIGPYPCSNAENTDADEWPLTSGTSVSYLGQAVVLRQMGFAKIGVFGGNAGANIQHESLCKQGITAAGATYVGPDITFPLTNVTDYSPYAQMLKQTTGKGAQAFCMIVGPIQGIPLLAALHNLGGSATVIEAGAFGASDFAKAPPSVTEGMLQDPGNPPSTATSIPMVKLWVQQQSAGSGPGAGNLDSISQNTFISFFALQKLLASTSTVITSSTVNALLATSTPVNVLGFETWVPNKQGPAQFPRIQFGNVYVTKVHNRTATLISDKPIDVFTALNLAHS